MCVALGLLANERFPEAIAEPRLAIAERRLSAGRGPDIPWLVLIAAESESGQDAEARTDLQKFLSARRIYRSMAEIQKNRQFAANSKPLDGLPRGDAGGVAASPLDSNGVANQNGEGSRFRALISPGLSNRSYGLNHAVRRRAVYDRVGW